MKGRKTGGRERREASVGIGSRNAQAASPREQEEGSTIFQLKMDQLDQAIASNWTLTCFWKHAA